MQWSSGSRTQEVSQERGQAGRERDAKLPLCICQIRTCQERPDVSQLSCGARWIKRGAQRQNKGRKQRTGFVFKSLLYIIKSENYTGSAASPELSMIINVFLRKHSASIRVIRATVWKHPARDETLMTGFSRKIRGRCDGTNRQGRS